MKFYQAFDVNEETPVQWLAVHPLRWKTAEWGPPAIMFREVDDEIQTLADAAPDLLAALQAQQAYIDHKGNCLGCAGEDDCYVAYKLWMVARDLRCTALAKVKGDR